MGFILGTNLAGVDRVANTVTRQGMLDSTGVVTYPAGDIELALDRPTTSARPVVVESGAGKRISRVKVFPQDKPAAFHYLDRSNAPDASITDLTAFTTTGPFAVPRKPDGSIDIMAPVAGTFVFQSMMNRPASVVTLADIELTGFFNYAVEKAGGGQIAMVNSDLHAWVGIVAGYSGHDEIGGALKVLGGTWSCLGGKTDSIGAYIHPNWNVSIGGGITISDMQRWALYLNGNPRAGQDPVHTITDATLVNCALIQVAPRTHPVVANCVVSGTMNNGGSSLNGQDYNGTPAACSLTLIRTKFTATHMFGYSGAASTDMYGCEFNQPSVAFAFSGSGIHRFRDGCKFTLVGKQEAFTANSKFTGRVEMGDTFVDAQAASGPYTMQLAGLSTIDWQQSSLRSPSPGGGLIIPSSVSQRGTLTRVP